MAKGLYFVSLHPTGENPQWVATAMFSEAGLAAMNGIALITATTKEGQGGRLMMWDASKLAQGPVAGVDFGGLNFWPDQTVPGLWISGEPPGPRIGASVRDWFSNFVQQWAGNWWRR